MALVWVVRINSPRLVGRLKPGVPIEILEKCKLFVNVARRRKYFPKKAKSLTHQ